MSSAAFPRGWKRLQNNWAQSWRLGPLSFEVEWVPKARQFDFCLSLDFSGGRYDD